MPANTVFASPLGPILLTQTDGALTRLVFLPEDEPLPNVSAPTPLLAEAAAQLSAYFAGTLREFSLPLAPEGTAFQLRVLAALETVPWGETLDYGELAARCGCPGGARAVGAALHRNPLPILIPCHRVLGRGGALTGYAWGLERKRSLLALEGVRLPMKK